ncbi:MAG TPA: tetraacyldisaccharide 4'-kinase [Acidisarcina sp.]|nr:tetraacyldisaccharide 4'-kinase [Acidisarcina sp.]
MRRPLLLPLTPLFHAVVAARNAAYSQGWRRPRTLAWPVVSIGSITAGGAGKTPLVIRLAELLQSEGVRIDVLSRGYGRSSKATERVAPDGAAERFGDEPLLIARNAGVPVFVGSSRFAAGLLAEQSLSGQFPSGPGIHLLDDGFQHRQLSRAVDIVLVGAADLEDTLLPAGNLREPLRALRRANFLVVRTEERELVQQLRARGLVQPVWLVHRSLTVPTVGKRSVAFCGIARPGDFFSEVSRQVESVGREVVSWQSFPDHHRYTPADMEKLARLASSNRADSFLTTEKDAVKLDAGMRDILERAAPLGIVRLEVTLEDEKAAIQSLIRQARE